MVAVLVLATFICFVVVDYFLHTRRPRTLQVTASSAQPEAAARADAETANIVDGFEMVPAISYHSGHAWAAKETRNVVRVGLDDFAVRLLGKVDRINLPARGRWLRQGEKGWTVVRGSHSFEMLSPIEGEVVDVNTEVMNDPSLMHREPYGAGWLLAVNSPAADSNLKNLLRGRVAQQWMEVSVETFRTHVSPAAGAHLQDGGHAIADLLSELPEERWEEVVGELFLA